MPLDIEKFFSDPKYQNDRELMEAVVQRTLEKRAQESRAKEKPDSGSIWDFLFWRAKSDEDVSIFDRLFGGK